MLAFGYKLPDKMNKLVVFPCDTNRSFQGKFPNKKPGVQCRFTIAQNGFLTQLSFTFDNVKFAFYRIHFLELMQKIVEGQSAQELLQTFQIVK